MNVNRPLLERLPEYKQIILDLSGNLVYDTIKVLKIDVFFHDYKGRGNLKINDVEDGLMRTKKSKLCHKLNDLLSMLYENDQNDELSYFILFMDANHLNNFIKFLLDVHNFESLLSIREVTSNRSSMFLSGWLAYQIITSLFFVNKS